MDDDFEQLEEIKGMEEEEKKTFKSVINKKRLGNFEMDMLFFQEEKEESDE